MDDAPVERHESASSPATPTKRKVYTHLTIDKSRSRTDEHICRRTCNPLRATRRVNRQHRLHQHRRQHLRVRLRRAHQRPVNPPPSRLPTSPISSTASPAPKRAFPTSSVAPLPHWRQSPTRLTTRCPRLLYVSLRLCIRIGGRRLPHHPHLRRGRRRRRSWRGKRGGRRNWRMRLKGGMRCRMRRGHGGERRKGTGSWASRIDAFTC